MATKLDESWYQGLEDSAINALSGLKALAHEVRRLEKQQEKQEKALQSIMDNLGVPQPGYPAPVAEAYEIAKAALSG